MGFKITKRVKKSQNKKKVTLILLLVYSTWVGLSQACYTGCKTCKHNKPHVDRCLTCFEGWKHRPGKWGGFCDKCHDSCKACTNLGDNDCTACSDPDFRVMANPPNPGICANNCGHDKFKGATHCQDCDASCDGCDGPDNNDCIQCRSDPGQRHFKTADNRCVQDCPARFYEHLATKSCLPCSAGCLNCSYETGLCYQCEDAHLLENSAGKICVLTCKGNEFWLNEGKTNLYKRFETDVESSIKMGVCAPCHSSCATCSIVMGNDECDTCKEADQRVKRPRSEH